MTTSGILCHSRGRAPVVCEHLIVIMVCALLAIGLCEKAHASDRQTVADVRCVVVGLRMVQMTMPQQRAAGMMLAMYYLGRLDGRASHAEIEELIEREVGKMNQAEFRASAARCGKALARKGKEIQKIGAALVRKGQGEAAPK